MAATLGAERIRTKTRHVCKHAYIHTYIHTYSGCFCCCCDWSRTGREARATQRNASVTRGSQLLTRPTITQLLRLLLLMLLLAAKMRLELDRKGSASHAEKRKRYARLTPPNQSHSHTVVVFVVIDVAAGRETHTISNEERHHHAYNRSLTNHGDEATKNAKSKSTLPNSHGA